MLTIQLDGAIEDRLKSAAKSQGTAPEIVARRVLEENLLNPNKNGSESGNEKTLALLAEWEREDATSDPAELQRRHEEGEELMRNLARNRIESEGPLARKLWP